MDTGRAAVCRVLPSTATTGERRGRRRTACRTRKGRPRRAQAAGPDADSTTDMSLRRFFHILVVTALSAAALLALAAPAALAKSYSDVPSSHWAHSYISSVTNRSVDGHAAPGRLRHAVPAGARHHARAPGALRRPRVRALRPEHHPGDDQRRPRRATATTPSSRWRSTSATCQWTRTATSAPRRRSPTSRPRPSMVRWLKDRYPTYDWSLLEHPGAQPLGAQPRLDNRRAVLPAGDGRLAAARAPLQPPHRGRRARGPPQRADRPRRGGLHVLPRLSAGERLAALRPRRLQGHHVPASQRPPEADRRLRAQVHRLPVHLGGRVPDPELAVRPPGVRAASTAPGSSST